MSGNHLFLFYKSDVCDLVLTKINQRVKYKFHMINSFQYNDRKPFCLRTDGPNDRPTLAKQFAPSFSMGGIKTLLTKGQKVSQITLVCATNTPGLCVRLDSVVLGLRFK